jgi:hypothetical protein
MIEEIFLRFATDILGETEGGLTSTQIINYSMDYALQYDVEIPYFNYPFEGVPNKRTALKENIKAFPPAAQFVIIRDLCDLPMFSDNKAAKNLKIKLISRYGALAQGDENAINESLIEETKHWLEEYPDVLNIYNGALEKWADNIHQRNLLDDIRLSVELLLKGILGNQKSMENQQKELGDFISEKGASKELNNMFLKLVDYFGKYNNTYIKHNDNVNDNEIEIIVEIASSFMKFLIKIK